MVTFDHAHAQAYEKNFYIVCARPVDFVNAHNFTLIYAVTQFPSHGIYNTWHHFIFLDSWYVVFYR